MNITFTAMGLEFEAEVSVTSTPRRATEWEPEEDFEIEIESLTVGGKDAMFLFDSCAIGPYIDEAAVIAAEEKYRDEADEAAFDYAVACAEDRYYEEAY